MVSAPPRTFPNPPTFSWRRFWLSRDFARYWSEQSVSAFGSYCSSSALTLLAIVTLHATPVQLGLLAGAGTLPTILLGPLAGLLADRLPRRPLLIAADIGRAALLAGLAAIAWLGDLRFTLLVAVLLAANSLTLLFATASHAVVPALVESADLVAANARLATSDSVAELGGPSLGAILFPLIGAPLLIVGDALSFVISALSLGGIRPRPAPAHTLVAEERPWRTILAGWPVIWRDPWLRALAAVEGLDALRGGFFVSLYTFYAIHDLRLSPGAYGILISLGGFSALFGGALAARLNRLGPRRSVLAARGLTLIGLPTILLAYGSPLMGGIWLGLGQLTDCTGSAYTILTTSLRQGRTPDHALGRVNAAFQLLATLPLLLGAALASGLSLSLPVHTVLAFTTGIELLAGSVLWCLLPEQASLPQ